MNIIHFLGNVYKHATLLAMCRHISLLQRSVKRRGRFFIIEVDILLALDTSEQRIAVVKSTIPHPEAGMGLFVYQAIGKREVVLYFYGSLGYANLTEEQHKTRNYGKGVIHESDETLRKIENELLGKAIDKDGIDHKCR